eukprot:TRINITY_DN2542_c0_g2::TRINITY_DN2542_c0_g2_i1::g.19266::m.19266 TRINITY_DN2542_c0_g2::TRINITY_DN2542_c0_g2_i1::g.19266  ORF type:complete len:611 (-),score=245.34,sp/P29341/PABP1_MOUSE/54.91/0.0,RRM_1/PF00076.17/5.4e-20,RRM_1/PF00076.17/1e-17,RRM_1/PF00076.17/1.2e-15,RRM_1/PF00076.17/3e-18,RRM_6/PF14259.1/2.2e-14,RRM_6/PF14259.1/1.3e-09,RRM_6/PF14259.1/6.2e-10,RRM_6/PF14259.1/8.8e-13,RRM_5/PF13893.1/7.4e-10,RRM_5/PF13893.1/1.4e-09,RRM_5/PF13893.1/2.8e-11,RRM_5/PF13893.1/2.2e-09,PABP/PF00658.13/7
MVAMPPFASASLYVGDLSPEVTEAVLFEIFSQAGPVASIRVCRDAITRRSLGYAYVNFHSVQDAERALDTLNFTAIKNKPIRIMWSHRDPAVRKSGDSNIFIKSLEKTIDNKALYDTFSCFGNILSCKVCTDEKGNSKGYGFVHFETREAAELAIEKVNGMLMNEKKVFVGWHKKHEERMKELGQVGERFNNVYVKNFGDEVTAERLHELFIKHGEILSSVVLKDKFGRPFAFISFKNHEAAKSAVEGLNNTELNGKTLYVSRAQKKAEREAELRRKWEDIRQERERKYQGVNLYVKNLDDTVDDDRLRKEFAQFGTITSSKVMSEDGRSKGFGFVCFTTPEEATRALTEMNGRILVSKPLYVALAQRRDQRRTQLEAMHMQRQNARMFPGPQPPVPGQPAMYPQPLFYTSVQHAQRQFMYPQMVPRQPGGFGMQQQQPGRQMQQQPGGRFQGGAVANSAQVPVPAQHRGQRRMPGQPMQGQGAPQGAPADSTKPMANKPVGAGQQRGGARNNYPAGAAGARPEGLPQVPPLTAGELASMTPELAKQAIGERLFPLIHKAQPELAGKITGMLLEMDNAELLHLLESPQALDQKVAEAVAVLEAHSKQQDK